MTQRAVFGLHTAEFKKWISEKEANAVKGFFGLRPDEELSGETCFYDQGLTKLYIEKVPGKGKPRYFIHAVVNFTRAAGYGGHAAMPYTTANVKRAYKAIDGVLKTLPLSNRNNRIAEWTPKRVDSAFDIYEEQAELLMRLLNRSADLSDARKKCRRMRIPGKMPEEAASQSLRFGNASFTYNIYRKMEEIRDKGKPVTEEEKALVRNLLRIERQSHGDAVRKLLPGMKAGDLAKAGVRGGILKTMLDETELFFGRGNFYSWKQIQKAFCPNRKADIGSIKGAMAETAKSSLEAARGQGLYPKETGSIFDRLGISPAGIRADEVKQYGTDFMQGIYGRIAAEYPRPPDKRPYHPFPVPHKTADGRYKATVTLYSVPKGVRRVQIAARTPEDYERRVLRELKTAHASNRRYRDSDDAKERKIFLKSADSVCRFRKVAKTGEAREGAERFLKALNAGGKSDNDGAV